MGSKDQDAWRLFETGHMCKKLALWTVCQLPAYCGVYKGSSRVVDWLGLHSLSGKVTHPLGHIGPRFVCFVFRALDGCSDLSRMLPPLFKVAGAAVFFYFRHNFFLGSVFESPFFSFFGTFHIWGDSTFWGTFKFWVLTISFNYWIFYVEFLILYSSKSFLSIRM